MALTIVECLRDLAKQGKTIICTIHQPSSEVFQKFDNLCLLAEGRLAYIGRLDAAEKFFSSQGFDIPIHHNPSDYYIQSLAMIPGKKEESEEIIDKICFGFQQSIYFSILNQDIVESNGMVKNPETRIELKNRIRYLTLFRQIFNFPQL